MKLNKEICERCCNESDESTRSWDSEDERHWQAEGIVHCPGAFPVSIDDVLPEWCPYAVEHAVSQNHGASTM